MAKFEMGFGDNLLELSIPDERVIQVIEGKQVEPVTDVKAAVKAAVSQPIGSPPLSKIVTAGEQVAVIVSDITRSWINYGEFLPVLLDELNGCGIPDRDILLVVALGAHRRHTAEENVLTYGREAVNRVRIIQSYAMDKDEFKYAGTTSRGVKAFLNRHAVEADKIILTGGIVYHSMAGFGGGRKGIVPGIASYETIQANHSFCLHEQVGGGINPGCDSGRCTGNHMHEDLMEIAAMLNPAFLLNVVQSADGQFARFVAGHWEHAWIEGCRTAAAIFGVPVHCKADLVIASAGGFPKDVNLYQGTKALDNAIKALKDNGVVILLLECREISEPPDFSGWFDYQDLYAREVALRKAFTVPGFVALKNGYDFKRIPVILVTLPENRAFAEKAGMYAVHSIEEAMALAGQKLGRDDYTVIIMPHAATTVPIVRTED